MTKKKSAWANKFKPNMIKGTNLNYNAAVMARYEARLTALVNQMAQQTEREIKKLFKTSTAEKHFEREMTAQDADISSQARILVNDITRRFQHLFNLKSKSLAEQMLKETDKASQSAVETSLKALSGGLTIKASAITEPMKTIMKATIAENVKVIRSILQRYFIDVQGAVMRSITTGNGLQDLVPALQKYKGITHRRARTIALDQTRKAYSNLNYERMANNGVKKFEWIHSNAGLEPRKLHLQLDGNVFRMDDLPVIDEKTGERGIPGS